MHTSIITSVLSLALSQTVLAASPADWRSRSIYQVMTDRFARSDGSTTAECNAINQTYCGGQWQGVTNNLDYIQGMGFDAVWISPVTAQIQGNSADGDAYHGYWQQNLYFLNDAFGTIDDLVALSAALHARGMYLMVDIVVNHMGWIGDESTIDYSSFGPFNTQSDYHDFCLIDYTNETSIKECWVGDNVVPLPDLRTENSNVAEGFQTWIGQLVANYSIDGLRLDTVMQVDTSFWSGFNEAAGGLYMLGEINQADSTYVCGYQSYVPGVFNYGTYFTLMAAFQNTTGDMSALASSIAETSGACSDMSLLGTFSENQDNTRFPTLNFDIVLAKNVIAFSMLTDGIPVLYQGQEQHYNGAGGVGTPYNRGALWFSGYNTDAELYVAVTAMNAARKAAIADDASYLTTLMDVNTDDNHIYIKKGKMSLILNNLGSPAGNSTLTAAMGYAANTQLTEIFTCETLTADSSGSLAVPMSAGAPRVYMPTDTLSGDLCGASAKVRRSVPYVRRPRTMAQIEATILD